MARRDFPLFFLCAGAVLSDVPPRGQCDGPHCATLAGSMLQHQHHHGQNQTLTGATTITAIKSTGDCDPRCVAEIANLKTSGDFKGALDELCSPSGALCEGCSDCQADGPAGGDGPTAVAIEKKRKSLQHFGPKGQMTLSTNSKTPCRLRGELAYHGMILHFDIYDGGMNLTKNDGHVLYAAELKDNNSGTLTVEDETFLEQNVANKLMPKTLLHVGKHRDHFHTHTGTSIGSAFLQAGDVQREMSKNIWNVQHDILLNDEYDNLAMELLVALASKGISAVSHKCFFAIYPFATYLQKNSKVVDTETKSEMEKVSVTDKEIEDAAHNVSLAETGGSDSLRWGRRRRRRYRCPYDFCNNPNFGRCGDGAGAGVSVGCVWPICMNCDCNIACEVHDEVCHCPWMEAVSSSCGPSNAALVWSTKWGWGSGCNECRRAEAEC